MALPINNLGFLARLSPTTGVAARAPVAPAAEESKGPSDANDVKLTATSEVKAAGSSLATSAMRKMGMVTCLAVAGLVGIGTSVPAYAKGFTSSGSRSVSYSAPRTVSVSTAKSISTPKSAPTHIAVFEESHPSPAAGGAKPAAKPGTIQYRYTLKQMSLPQGGFATAANQTYGKINSVVLPKAKAPGVAEEPPRVQKGSSYLSNRLGSNWDSSPRGFYSGDNFWLGYVIGSMNSHNYQQSPVYVYTPSCDCQSGQVLPPNGQSQFVDDTQTQLAVLQVMAKPAPGPDGKVDETAGLYHYDKDFDPAKGGALPKRVTAEEGFNELRKDQSVLFHPAGGDWQQLDNLQDLHIYMYSKYSKSDAPQAAQETSDAQEVQAQPAEVPDGGIGLGGMLLGLGAVGGVAGAGVLLSRKLK